MTLNIRGTSRIVSSLFCQWGRSEFLASDRYSVNVSKWPQICSFQVYIHPLVWSTVFDCKLVTFRLTIIYVIRAFVWCSIIFWNSQGEEIVRHEISLTLHMLQNSLDLGLAMRKSEEYSQDIKEQTLALHKSSSSLGTISRQLDVAKASVQTIVHEY